MTAGCQRGRDGATKGGQKSLNTAPRPGVGARGLRLRDFDRTPSMHTRPHRRTGYCRLAASIAWILLWMTCLPAQMGPLLPPDRLEAAKRNRLFPENTTIYTLLNPAIRTLRGDDNQLFVRGSLERAAAQVLDSAGDPRVPRSAVILQASIAQALQNLFDGSRCQECDSLKGVGGHNANKPTPALLCAIDATVEVGLDGRTIDLQLSVRLARVTFANEHATPTVIDLLFADQGHGRTVLPAAPPTDQPEARAEYAKLVESRFADACATARNQIMLLLFGYPRVFDRNQAWSTTLPPTFGGTLRGGEAR